MSTEDRRVVWRALLDVVNLSKNAKRAERDLKNLEDRERSVGKAFEETDKTVQKATENQAASASRLRSSLKNVSDGYNRATRSNKDFRESITALTKEQEKYNKLAAVTEQLANKQAAAKARYAAAQEREVASMHRLADAQNRLDAASKSHTDLLKKQGVAQEELTKSAERLEKAHARVVASEAKLAESSAATVRAHGQQERAAKAASNGNDQLALSMERVRSKTIQVQKASQSGFGRDHERTLRNLRQGYNNLSSAASNFTDLLLIKVPGAVAGLAAIGNAISALLAGFVGLAGAISPIIGLLGALPGAFAAGITGIGSMLAAFKGVGAALKAYSKDQKTAAKTAQQNARQEVQAARSVRDAKRNVRDAYEQAGRAAEQSAQRIQDAEKNVARAQKEAQKAQEDLTRARADALRQIEDLKNAVRDAGFSEREATLSLAEARDRLEKTKTDPNANANDLARAQLDLEEAQARLSDAQKAKADTIKESAEAQKKGVEGSDQVVAAQERAKDAVTNVADAQKQLIDAQKDAQRQARDSAEAIQRALENQADAQQALSDAIKETSGAASAFNDEMKKLSPAAQRFVTYLISLKSKLTDLQHAAQEGMLPGAQAGLQSLMTMFPMVLRTVGNVSKIIGDTFANLGKKLSDKSNSAAIGRVFESNERALKSFSDGVVALAGYFVHVADAARPLVEHIANLFKNFAKSREAIPTKQLSDFFAKTRVVLDKLISIFGNLYRGFKNVGKAGEDLGNDILDALDKVTKKWADWTGTVEGQNELKQWFDDAKPIIWEIGRLIRDLSKTFLDLSTSDSFAPFLETLRTKVLPNIKTFFDILSKNGAVQGFADFLVSVSQGLVTMAESGAMGGLSKALDFLTGLLNFAQNIFKIPGIGAIISTMAAALLTFKVMKFGAQITGLKNLYDGIKKMYDLGKNRKNNLKGLQTDIQGLAAATGQTPEQVAQAYGVTGGSKKGRVKKKAFGPQPKPTGVGGRIKGAVGSPRGKAIAKGGAGALGVAAGVAVSMLPMEGPLANILGIVTSLIGFLPLLIPLFAPIGAAIAAIGAPILAIVGIVAGLIAIFVLLFNKNKGFHDFVVKAWENIKSAIAGAWNNYIFPALKAFWGFITDVLAPAFVWLWEHAIKPAFEGIAKVIGWAWNNVIKPVFGAIWGFISELLAPLFWWLWKTIIKVAWEGITGLFKSQWALWSGIFRAVYDFLKQTLGPVFSWLWEKIVKPVWGWISGAIKGAWDAIKPIFDKLNSGIGGVGKAFEAAKTAISKAWGNVTSWISGPIQSALQWVQQHLIDPINNLLGKIGISFKIGAIWTAPTNPTSASVASGIRHADGGMIGGSSPHDRADNIPALLTAGEYVLPVRAVRAISREAGPGYLEQLRQGKPNRRKYATGGFVKAVNGNPSFPWGRYPSGGIHRALDIPVPVGTPVVSSLPGRVLRAGWDTSGFGNHIRMAFNNGTYMILGHLSRILAKEGESKYAGQRIALSGNTGRSTGPHVHVEMRRRPYDPDSSFNFSDSWYNGKVPAFTKQVRTDNLLSNIALGTYDIFAAPLKAALGSVLPKFGVFGNFLSGAGLKIIQGIRDKVADWTMSSETVADNGDPNAPRDSISPTVERSFRTGERFASGGRVPGTGNQDTVRAMLTPGEYVLRKDVVSRIGVDRLNAINGGAGGRYKDGVAHFNAGGPVVSKSGVTIKEGGRYSFINLMRMLYGLGYSSQGLTQYGYWGSDLSNKIRANKGSIPNLAKFLYPVWDAATMRRIGNAVNAGTAARQKSLGDVSKATGINNITLAIGARKYGGTLAKYMNPKEDDKFWRDRNTTYGWYSNMIKNAAGYMGRSDTAWSYAFQQPLMHMMFHGMNPQWPHSNNWPVSWPLTALQVAVQQQNAANALNVEFNKNLDTLSQWGYGYLVDKLLELGPQDGIGLSREAVKSKTVAADYNASLQRASQISATSDVNSLKFVSYLANTSTPGIRGSARELGVPDYQVIEMWDKLVKAGRINPNLAKFGTMLREISLFRKGLFYANGGGVVPGTGSGDTVPAMLTPGEFVLRKSVVRALGLDNVQAMNNMQYFANGGLVYNAQVGRVPGINEQGFRGISNALMRQGQALTTVNINTTINNPIAEQSSASLNKMLRRKAAVGEFGVGAHIGEDKVN